jgi:hypothetical protein
MSSPATISTGASMSSPSSTSVGLGSGAGRPKA